MSDLHSPVPIFCSDFAEEEHSHHPSYVYCMPTEKLPYCNSVEGQSIAYFEATLTSPNFEETKNLPKLFCNLDPSISSTQASNSSPPTSSYLHGDMFPFLHGSAESSQFDGFTSYSSSLSDLHTAGIEEAQKPVGSNNEPVFPPALCIPSAKPHNSILLLKYYQMKHMVEGEHVIDSRRIAVTDKEIQKLLKLPTLQAKLSGVVNLVNFVTKCLHVDPDLRPAAKDLLKDPFLY